MTELQTSDATVIVMDPKQGNPGLANRPDYDLNNFAAYPRKTGEIGLFLMVLNLVLPFKIITTAAALEEGVVNDMIIFGSWPYFSKW